MGYRQNSEHSIAVIGQKLSNEDIAAIAACYQRVESALETTLSAGKE
jgi:hypothetical protein